MKKAILILILAITGITLFAQSYNRRPVNSININLFGDASLISVNYEKLFLVNSTLILTGKLGVGFIKDEYLLWGNSLFTIPHHITGNWGYKRHFFEFGLGGTSIFGNSYQNYILYPIIGYRILPLNSNKVNFRLFGQYPLFRLNKEDYLLFPFGISLGISF